MATILMILFLFSLSFLKQQNRQQYYGSIYSSCEFSQYDIRRRFSNFWTSMTLTDIWKFIILIFSFFSYFIQFHGINKQFMVGVVFGKWIIQNSELH